jgi:hypothetical protein
MKSFQFIIPILAFGLLCSACKKKSGTDPVDTSNHKLIEGTFYTNRGYSNFCITDDGGVAFVALTKTKQLYVGKASFNLDLQWNKTLDSAVNNAGGICASGDGGIIVIGNLYNYTNAKHAISVKKLNNSGDVVWEKKYWFDFPSGEAPPVRKTSDNGFMILICNYYPGETFPVIPTLFKINSAGDSIWSHWLPGMISMTENDFQLAPDQGFVVVGRYRILKTDSIGNQQWLQELPSINPINVCMLDNGSSIILGNKMKEQSQGDPDMQDLGLIKFDPNGNKLWEQSYDIGYMDYAFSLCPSPEGGFIFTYKSDGMETTLAPGLIKTDENGNQLSTQDLPGIIPIGLVNIQGKYIYYGVRQYDPDWLNKLMLYSFQL